jgi:hypothetical protein
MLWPCMNRDVRLPEQEVTSHTLRAELVKAFLNYVQMAYVGRISKHTLDQLL